MWYLNNEVLIAILIMEKEKIQIILIIGNLYFLTLNGMLNITFFAVRNLRSILLIKKFS